MENPRLGVAGNPPDRPARAKSRPREAARQNLAGVRGGTELMFRRRMSLSPPIQSVLELFKGPLANVRFADIDAAGLAKLAAEVESAGSEVDQQEHKLAELRQALAQRQEALLTLAQRALAYARVYAEEDELLLEELNRIVLPRPAKPKKPSARGNGARDAARAEPVLEAAEAPEADEPSDADELPAAEAAPRAVRKGRGRPVQPVAD